MVKKEVVAPVEPDESIDAVLDVDGTEVVVSPLSSTQADNTWGIFKDATGETKMSSTEKIAVNGTFSLTLNRVLKAADYETINIRMHVTDWTNDGSYKNTTTGYSVDDTSFANPAGSIESDYRSLVTLSLDPAKLADANGNIQTIVIKKTSTKADLAAEQVHIDYVEIVTKKSEPVVEPLSPTENTSLDFDGVQAGLVNAAGTAADNANGVFASATGATKHQWTGAIKDGNTMTINLEKPVLASALKEIVIKMCVGDWVEGNNVTTTAYAATDTEFANPAGSYETPVGNANKECDLVIDPAKVADENGLISAIVLKRTDSVAGSQGQYFFDSVELIIPTAEPDPDPTPDPNPEPTEPDESIDAILDADGTEVVVSPLSSTQADNTWNIFKGATGETKMSSTEKIGVGGTFTLTLNRVLKAEDYESIIIKLAVVDWANDGTYKNTTTGYAVTDTEFANPAGYVETDYKNTGVTLLTLDPAKLANENGLIQTIVLKKTSENASVAAEQVHIDYVEIVTKNKEPLVPDESIDAVLDADGTEVVVNPLSSTQADNSWGLFKNTTGETMMSSTEKIAVGDTFTLTLNRVLKAEDYEEIKIRLNACDWGNDGTYVNTLTGYSVIDTEFATPAGYIETDYRSEAILTLDPAKLADADGMIQTIVLKKTSENASVAAEQVHIDYVEILTKKPDEYTSKILLAGDLITNKNPQNIVDDQVTWATGVKHGEYEQYGYTTSNLMLGFNKTNFPNFDIYETDVPDYNAIRASKVVVPIKVGKLLASNYAQLEFTLYFTDWNSGMHQFYLYGSNTQKFIENGEAVGYAAEFVSTGPQTKMKIKVDDVASLADENGYIEYLYIMYYGNVLDEGNDVFGCFISGVNSSCTQLWLNEVNFYVQEDVKVPVQSEVFIEKDVSEILPIGDGTTFNVESKEENTTSIVAAAKTAAYDSLTLTVLPTYTGDFSTAILTHALKGTDKLEDSGIFFSLNNNGIHIGAIKGTTRTDKIVEGNFFPTGVATKVTLNAIPGYLEGVLDGFFLSVYIGDSEEAVIELYVALADANIGSYTNIITQDLGTNYSVKLASALETAISATDIMNVTVSPKNGGTEFKRERVSLILDYFEVEGNIISDLQIVGNATFNAETNFLEFTAPGTVTVSYTVTNAFGTFTSNELTLTYAPEAETPTPDTSTDDNQNGEDSNGGLFGGCFGGIGSVGVLAPLALAGVALIRRKKNHADENDADKE